jgi:hypothetical protein
MEIGNVLLDEGNAAIALDNYREGLAVAERSLRRATSSLNHALDRADLLEALGRYYLSLAGKAGLTNARRTELKGEARSYFQKEIAIWQDWTRRKVASPYAGRRETKTLAYLASCDQP